MNARRDCYVWRGSGRGGAVCGDVRISFNNMLFDRQRTVFYTNCIRFSKLVDDRHSMFEAAERKTVKFSTVDVHNYHVRVQIGDLYQSSESFQR